MERLFPHLQIDPTTATITNNNSRHSLKKRWLQWKVSYLSVQQNGALSLRDLNIFQRILRFLFRAYANTHSKSLQKALQHDHIEWSPIKGKGSETRRDLLEKMHAAQQQSLPIDGPKQRIPSLPDYLSVDYLKKEGKKENPLALLCLAKMYEEGNKVSQNFEQAIAWYKKIIDFCHSGSFAPFIEDQACAGMVSSWMHLAKSLGNRDMYSLAKDYHKAIDSLGLRSMQNRMDIQSSLDQNAIDSIKGDLKSMLQAFINETLLKQIENKPHTTPSTMLDRIDLLVHTETTLEKEHFILLTFPLLFLWKGQQNEQAKSLLHDLVHRTDVPKDSTLPSFSDLSDDSFLENSWLQAFTSLNSTTTAFSAMLYEAKGNREQAEKYFAESSVYYDAPIMVKYKRAQMLEKNEADLKNKKKAVEFYKKSSRYYPTACNDILRLYREWGKDETKIQKVLEDSAKHGSISAMRELLAQHEKKGNQEMVEQYRQWIAIASQSYHPDDIVPKPQVTVPDYTWLLQKDSLPSSPFLKKFSFPFISSMILKQLDALEKNLHELDDQGKQKAIRAWADDLTCYVIPDTKQHDPTALFQVAQFFDQHAFTKEAQIYYEKAAFQHSLPAMDVLAESHQNQLKQIQTNDWQFREKFTSATYWKIVAWLFETDPTKKSAKESDLTTWLDHSDKPDDIPTFQKFLAEELTKTTIFDTWWVLGPKCRFNQRCRGKLALDYQKTSEDDIQKFQAYEQNPLSPDFIHQGIAHISKMKEKILKQEAKGQIPHKPIDEEDKIALYRRLSYLYEKNGDLKTSSLYLAGAVFLGYRPSEDEFSSVKDRLSSFL